LLTILALVALAPRFAGAQGVWATKAPMPNARAGVATAVANGQLYAIGGSPIGGFATTVVEAYDPATDTWTKKAPAPTPRAYASAAAIGGKIYRFQPTAALAAELLAERVVVAATGALHRRGGPRVARRGITTGRQNLKPCLKDVRSVYDL
jgi:N-acetylneuraminic acid mutarotase